MSSLKRSWTSSSDSIIVRKKIRSNTSYAPTAILPQNRSLAPGQASDSSFRTLQSNVPLLCIHKRLNACSLSLTVCCACADKRPLSDTYTVRPVDVPEHGPVQIKSRAEYYCPNCRGMMQMVHFSCNTTDCEADFWICHKISSSLAISTSEPCVASSGHDTIRVSCADKVFDLVRPNNMTPGELQHAVALLMRCDSSELMFIASDVDLERDPDALGRGLAACLAYAAHIHFGIRCREDVEMAEAPSLGGYQ